MSATAPIERVDVSAYRIPTDRPEADGTLDWDATTLVLARVRSGGHEGLGYTYAHRAAAALIADPLRACLLGQDALDIAGRWQAMNRALRNVGRPGVGAMAASALDVALWDLKARLLGISVTRLLGRVRNEVLVYGSGGFTTYTLAELGEQLAGWVARGMRRVKMKLCGETVADGARVRAAREAIGGQAALMVDANGAYRRKQALQAASAFAAQGVDWFEEPVSSEDLEGLRLLRDRAPAGMDIAAGEYGWDGVYFRRMLEAGAVDVLQVDATRCGGFSGFLQAAALAQAHGLPVSAHCAPHLHAHVCCAVHQLAHVEYFHDHARIESMLFDGLPQLRAGTLAVDGTREGLGLVLREADARPFLLDGEGGA